MTDHVFRSATGGDDPSRNGDRQRLVGDVPHEPDCGAHASAATHLRHALTVDVEDYYHVSAFADRIRPHDWDAYESRVEANTRRLLGLFDRAGTRATFFVLGWVAERCPRLVADLRRAGHEIGLHSYWHRLIYEQSPDEFLADLRRGRDVLQDILGEPVDAYRAPSFSVTRRSLWALDILAAEGFRLDSSIFPVRHDRYGIPDAPVLPHRIETPSGDLHEFPGTVLRLGGWNVPVSGGGYLRLYPGWLTERCLAAFTKRHASPFMLYLHPWEIDPDQPRLAGSWKSRFRHYQNLRTTEPKLTRLLDRFRFGTMSESLQGLDRLAPQRTTVPGFRVDPHPTATRHDRSDVSAKHRNTDVPRRESPHGTRPHGHRTTAPDRTATGS